MTSPAVRPTGRDRRFREVLQSRPINVREVGPSPAAPLALSIRRFPFPYRAGLAISNDTRTMTRSVFDELHSAFTGRGLELGAMLSFGEGDVCNARGPLARDMHAAGLADSVAGLSAAGPEDTARQLAEAGFRPKCFIGDAGLDTAVPLRAAGVRYFTDPSFAVGEKFGDGLDLRSTARLQEAFGRFDYDDLGAGEMAGTDLDSIWDAAKDDERRQFAVDLFNSVLLPLPSCSVLGSSVFKRYRGGQRPALTTLPLQLRSMFLDALETGQGAIVIEQRLGETALIGQAPEQEQRRRLDGPALSLHEEVALDELAERATEKLLVTTPGRLLDWVRLQSTLRFEVDETADRWLIRLIGLDGSANPLGLADVDGLSFTLPADGPEALVIFEGNDQPLPMKRSPEPSVDGHHCIHLPWENRAWAPC
ncbi:hypothetical protein [Sphingomonas arenae]|uniref:hypothetical protein n=1 Tax=Sphingomonas arenae TaxID=2812555 RepID=UPI001967DD4F|nr:hypothetical protein [Sphingomonas arenae]